MGILREKKVESEEEVFKYNQERGGDSEVGRKGEGCGGGMTGVRGGGWDYNQEWGGGVWSWRRRRMIWGRKSGKRRESLNY